MSEEIDWDSLTFSLTPTDTMYITDTDMNDAWMPGELIPYGDMKISPAAGHMPNKTGNPRPPTAKR